MKVKTLGHIVAEGEELWLLSSGAEAGFFVTGATRVVLRLRADDTVERADAEHLRPRFEVRLNGKAVLNARMETPESRVTVFEGAEKRDAQIRLIKLSECTQSLMALSGIDTDGEITPLPEKELKMEFIGDSITCGYGVEGKSAEESFTTATENAAKGYAFLTAEALGADAVLTCFSGHGLISGYTGDPAVRNSTELVPPYYEKEGRNAYRLPSGRLAEEIPRDFAAFRPAYVVINLGTNDLSWCGQNPERGALYAKEYIAFLKTVRRNNPQARILCALGVMGTGLNGTMRKAVEDYCRETGDREVRILELEEQNAARDGLGSDSHPSAVTQRRLAERVTRELREWMAS